MKMMQGACFFACSNMSRTREAPTPTNISTKSEPEMVKNGTFASPAMALASRVLPVPGGPTMSTPRGILPPSCWNLAGSLRKSTSSTTSSLASSTPATSLNVTLTWSSPINFALFLPNDMAPLPPPPPCIWRMKKIQTPINSRNGNQLIKIWVRMEVLSGGVALMVTSCSSRSPTSALLSVSGLNVTKFSPSWYSPSMRRPSISTSLTRLASTL